MNAAIFKDAGLLRQYTAERYGAVLTFGGSLEAWRRGMRMVKILARMTGRGIEAVLADVREDFDGLSA